MPGDIRTDAARGGSRDTTDSIGSAARRDRKAIFGLRNPLKAGVSLAAVSLFAGAAPVAALDLTTMQAEMSVATSDVIQVAVFAGIMGAALLSAIWLIRERGRIAADNLELRGRLAEQNTALQRAESLLNLNDQRLVVWMKDRAKPDVVGSLGLAAGVPEERSTFLAFGRWLMARSASQLERAIADLREKGRTFELVVETQRGSLLEAHGRNSASNAIVRFVSLSDAQTEHARLRAEHMSLQSEYETIRGLIDALPMPFWLREAEGRLRWVNPAYAAAVETNETADVVRDGRELLPTSVRDAIAARHRDGKLFEQTVSTVIRGDRRLFSVVDYAGHEGIAGIATDRTEIETVREELRKVQRSHSETLDQLTTAVAIFDAQEKLRFYNQAFQKLWDLDVAFLDSAPANALLLDRLRTDGRIPEQPEWRRWKEGVLSAYRAVQSQEDWWHLPDGRTIRVVANPHPAGGVTWVFENLTERMDLESRYNAAVRVQGETLDNLAEGVAVFGPDGRLRLSNPSFAKLWGLPEELARPDTHIKAIRAACELTAKDSPWAGFAADVTGFADERRDRRGQVEMNDGAVLRYALINLPNGQVMITFVDVTDTVNVERALKDKNEALQMADQLKNDFVQHVSYELRSPLTTIIGFAHFLSDPSTGPLTPKQAEYLDYVTKSTNALLALTNNILDLATIDAGAMKLELGQVDVSKAIELAAEGIQDRLATDRIRLKVEIAPDVGSFTGDEKRVVQVLYNLLANAVGFSPQDSTVGISARRTERSVVFTVTDSGPGIPADMKDKVFNWFESRSQGSRHRGAGLGLSLVRSFVELHGGKVRVDSIVGRGTVVICDFPTDQAAHRDAAE